MEIIQGHRGSAQRLDHARKGVTAVLELEKIRIISHPAGRSLESSATAYISYTGWPQIWIETAVGHHYDVQHYVSLQVEARSNSSLLGGFRLRCWKWS